MSFLPRIADQITAAKRKTKFVLPENVQLQTHASGDILWLDWFHIPKELRNRGLGTEIYLKWEKSIPKSFKLIRLFAADSGERRSNRFWESVGFDYVYDSQTNDENDWMMWKGINGHRTPRPIKSDDQD